MVAQQAGFYKPAFGLPAPAASLTIITRSGLLVAVASRAQRLRSAITAPANARKNLPIIEPGLTLYHEEGIAGIEFPVGGRFIGVLAVDASAALAVIELKVSCGYDRVVGQLMRYMAWIQKHQAEPGQLVRGIIVAREISEDLLSACSLLPNVQLFEYELSLKVKSSKHRKQHLDNAYTGAAIRSWKNDNVSCRGQVTLVVRCEVGRMIAPITSMPSPSKT